MAEPFIGEIRPWALNYAPYGWAFCSGQIMPIAQNTALYSILGITFGGDGRTTFGLPNLQGRAPMHYGSGPGLTHRALGELDGAATVTLTSEQMPLHNHNLTAQNVDANSAAASNQFLAKSNQPGPRGPVAYNTYASAATLSPMSNTSVQSVGGGQSDENMQPYLTVNMCIALEGVFPSRS